MNSDIKIEINRDKSKNGELVCDITVPIKAVVERFILKLDPIDFGCVTPEEIKHFEATLKKVVEETEAMEEEKDRWFGNNGNEQQEEMFDSGWHTWMGAKILLPVTGGNTDWEAGWLAAKKYDKGN